MNFNSYNPSNLGRSKKVKQVLPCASAVGDLSNDWRIFVIKNTTGEKLTANLFDASGKFLYKEGIQNQGGITIEELTGSYEGTMNDLASNDQYCFDFIRASVLAGQDLQFSNSWSLKEDTRGTKGSKVVKDIHPSIFLDPYQQQANRVDIKTLMTITRQFLLEIPMEPNTTLTLNMHISKAVFNG